MNGETVEYVEWNNFLPSFPKSLHSHLRAVALLREGGFFCLIIPAIFNQESILGSVRMDPRLKLAGMTEGEMDAHHKLQV